MKIKDGNLKEVKYFDELDSTNLYSKKNDLDSDTLVITGNQTSGRGRLNHRWFSSPYKNLTFTLVKEIEIEPSNAHIINFYTSVILFSAIKNLIIGNDFEIFLKWPNDIILNGKKIAGVLTETNDTSAKRKKFFIGVGVNINQNVFPEELNEKATSLLIETDIIYEPDMVLKKIIEYFYEFYELLNMPEEIIHVWRQFAFPAGKSVSFRVSEENEIKRAIIYGYDKLGAILLKNQSGEVQKHYSGEISFIY